jgi:hypothetical protein
MKRSTVESWVNGPGDLKEEEVSDVPVPGESVKVRGLPASFSAKLLSRLKVTQEGRQDVGEVSTEQVQILQFKEGVIEPRFNEDQVRQIADKYGPAFHKVMARINALSEVDEEAIVDADKRFPVGGNGQAEPRRGKLGADPAVAEGVGG